MYFNRVYISFLFRSRYRLLPISLFRYSCLYYSFFPPSFSSPLSPYLSLPSLLYTLKLCLKCNEILRACYLVKDQLKVI